VIADFPLLTERRKREEIGLSFSSSTFERLKIPSWIKKEEEAAKEVNTTN
jgi:hypothetical protein